MSVFYVLLILLCSGLNKNELIAGTRPDNTWVIDLERRRIAAEENLSEAMKTIAEASKINAEASKTNAEAAIIQAKAAQMQAEALIQLVQLLKK